MLALGIFCFVNKIILMYKEKVVWYNTLGYSGILWGGSGWGGVRACSRLG